jgi:carbon storage regulator CsrA
MLVLSRRSGESIQIDSNIRVVVISVSKGRVKLGIEAPDHIRILRTEIEDCKTHKVDGEQVTHLTSDGVAPLTCIPTTVT